MTRYDLMLELKKLTGSCDVVGFEPYWLVSIRGHRQVIPSYSLSEDKASDLAKKIFECYSEGKSFGVDFESWDDFLERKLYERLD